MTKTSWKRDVRLAVELFGVDEVARVLRVTTAAVTNYVRGAAIPDPTSTVPNRLAGLLKE